MSKVVTINNEEDLIKQHPKSAAKLKDWLANELQEKPDSEEAEMLVVMVLRYNPRVLYNFFDGNKVFIQVTAFDAAGDILYGYSIVGQPTDMTDYTSRPEAEEAAFREAFKILEENENKGQA